MVCFEESIISDGRAGRVWEKTQTVAWIAGCPLSVYVHTCLSACPSSCLSVDSLQRYVKNAKLDKDQHSGHTESHKDVQCSEVEEGGWVVRKRMEGRDKGEGLE